MLRDEIAQQSEPPCSVLGRLSAFGFSSRLCVKALQLTSVVLAKAQNKSEGAKRPPNKGIKLVGAARRLHTHQRQAAIAFTRQSGQGIDNCW